MTRENGPGTAPIGRAYHTTELVESGSWPGTRANVPPHFRCASSRLLAIYAGRALVGSFAAHAGLLDLAEDALHRIGIGHRQCVRHQLFAKLRMRMVDGESV